MMADADVQRGADAPLARSDAPDDRRALEQRVAAHRAELAVAVRALQTSARDAVSPGRVVAEHPYRFVLGALAAGALWSATRRSGR